MRRKYILSREARTDLLQIWNYLGEHVSFGVADKVIADLHAGMQKIAQMPGLGHRREDLTDERVRFHQVHSYLIIYEFERKPVGISRILHTARDIRSILER